MFRKHFLSKYKIHILATIKRFRNLTVFRTFKQREAKAAELLRSAYIYFLTCSVLPSEGTLPVFINSVF
jgi:hypothetical protein